jgi:hypothetical protein
MNDGCKCCIQSINWCVVKMLVNGQFIEGLVLHHVFFLGVQFCTYIDCKQKVIECKLFVCTR